MGCGLGETGGGVERARESSGGGAVAEAAGVAAALGAASFFFLEGSLEGRRVFFIFLKGLFGGVLSLAGVESLVWG